MTEKYGFIYIWRDNKHNRYYVGCHWGTEDDGYICSSTWMKKAWKIRSEDFRRRILKTNIKERPQMYVEEQRYFDMIKPHEIKTRYYNLNLKNNQLWHAYEEKVKTIGEKISAAKKGKSTGPCSPEKAKAISEAKLAKQRKMTPEQRKNMSIGQTGKKQSEETKAHKRTLKAYNNGTIEIKSQEHPGEGWNIGRLPMPSGPNRTLRNDIGKTRGKQKNPRVILMS